MQPPFPLVEGPADSIRTGVQNVFLSGSVGKLVVLSESASQVSSNSAGVILACDVLSVVTSRDGRNGQPVDESRPTRDRSGVGLKGSTVADHRSRWEALASVSPRRRGAIHSSARRFSGVRSRREDFWSKRRRSDSRGVRTVFTCRSRSSRA